MKKNKTNNGSLKSIFFVDLAHKLMVLMAFFYISHLSASTYGQTTKITLDLQNVTVQEVISEIEKKTEFKFFLNRKDVDLRRRVDVKFDKANIEEILNTVFKNSSVDYEILNKQIILRERIIGNGEVSLPVTGTNALQQGVSGTVYDENGVPLPGVTVSEKNTSNGTITDFEGNFALNLTGTSATLVFSYIGFQTKQQTVALGAEIRVDMIVDVSALDEVVVTSFGIAKEKKALVYATQEVDGEAVSQVGNPNVLNGLQGKVAGVNVNLSSGMPGRTPTVNIRGSRSITGNNQPLYVIDGFPMIGQPQDLNPNDIATFNVLKGPTASALYGLRAANGVIVITTKTGSRKNDGPTITADLFYSIDEVGFLPELQQTYSQGTGENLNVNSGVSWGARISEIGTYTNRLGQEEVARAYDHSDAFFQTGATSNANISIANTAEDFSYYVGLGRSGQEGVVPTTDFGRTSFRLNGMYKVTDNFSASVFLTYAESDINDLPDLAGNKNYLRGIWEAPPSYDLAGTRFAAADNPYEQVYFRGGQNNPYWVVNNNYRQNLTNRTLGNLFLEYQITPSLSANYRVGVDKLNSNREEFRELGTGDIGRTLPPSGGLLSLENSNNSLVNSNLYLAYNKSFKEVWDVDVIVGNEFFDQRIGQSNTVGQNFVTGGFSNLANASLITASNTEQDQRIVGFYGNVNLGWDEKIYLNVTGRNDYVSNMPSENRSFFYPSIGTSFVLTNLFPDLNEVMSFAKIRASFAEVGQAGPLNVNNTGFRASNPGNFLFPFNGFNAFSRDDVRISPTLEPENTTTFELGLDFRFVQDRISLDYTYFNSSSEGQIFQVPLPFSTGASTEIRNGGEISSNGHEVILSLTPVSTDNFRWKFITNFTTFENTVESLADGVDRILISSPDGANDLLVAEEGQDFPSFVGISFLEDPNTGRPVVLDDPESNVNGMPIIDFENKVIGSPLPDFRMNFTNSFTYKNLTLGFQLDWSQGGQLFSQSAIETRFRGTSAETLTREDDIVINALKGTQNVDGSINITGENDISINQGFTYYTHVWQFRGAYQDALQDATFLRLRELNINYNFPESFLKNSFLSDLSIYFAGRNLFLITDSFVDPEVNYVETEGGVRTNSLGVEWNQLPQTRSYGLGLRASF